MKRQISDPYKVNWGLYGSILGISVFIMIVSAFCGDSCTITEIVENLALGCLASTIVALLIEIGNIKEKNEKANSVYDAVYGELKCQIMWYIRTWACLCCVAYKDKNYRQERHTWIKWYEIAKSEFAECDDSRQAELIHFFNEQLMLGIDGIEKSLKQIDSQQYTLKINELYDENLRKILEDYRFEFYAARLTLEREFSSDVFWESFDAIKEDLVQYISNWVDIKYYNYYRFRPYDFHGDEKETMRAIIRSEKSSK